MKSITTYLTGEFLLRWFPNGGSIILTRTIMSAGFLFMFYVIIDGILTTGIHMGINWKLLRNITKDNLEVGGAIFAGTYTLYYTRFASQWSYLADLYNMYMCTKVQLQNPEEDQKNNLLVWEAGIVEDAIQLHLATKPIFAPMVKQLLEDKEVRDYFIEHSEEGEKHFNLVKRKLGIREVDS